MMLWYGPHVQVAGAGTGENWGGGVKAEQEHAGTSGE
jgi:hypothetical protein